MRFEITTKKYFSSNGILSIKNHSKPVSFFEKLLRVYAVSKNSDLTENLKL